MVLVDTSVWITFLNGSDLNITSNVIDLLNEDNICICPPVYQEILQGVKHKKDFYRLKNLLDGLPKLEINPYYISHEAAELYFNLRKAGITIRKSFDCLIASYAIETGSFLYHDDKDFTAIASQAPLKIF